MNSFFKRKRLFKELKGKIDNGEDKDQLLEKYKNETSERNLRIILATIPNLDLKVKYKNHQKIVIGIWIIYLALEGFSAILDFILYLRIDFIASLVIPVIIFVGIKNFNGSAYMPGIIWFFLYIFVIMRELISLTSQELNDHLSAWILLITICYILIAIIFMLLVKRNVFHYYGWFFPRKKNGQYVFK